MRIEEKKELAKAELAKAFQLAADGVDVKMFSKFIDGVWHDMAEDEEAFERFSLEACGHVISHAETSGEGAITFIDAYEERFGKMPDVWFMDAQGRLDRDLFAKHILEGQVVTGWDCTPTHNC